MNKKRFIIVLIAIILLEIASILIFYFSNNSYAINSVEINRISNYVNNHLDNPISKFSYDYTVLFTNGKIYQTANMATNINDAILHGDIIVSITDGNNLIGHIIINNNEQYLFTRNMIVILSMAIIYTVVNFIIYFLYYLRLKKQIVDPFVRLEGFAKQVAYGNLDVPLEMDKSNVFGPFTEAFDIMREELKKAREQERLANESKKELVVKLSHDIKTPVASIMATSELGLAKDSENIAFKNIYSKAVQLNELVTNLFESSVEEVSHLNVIPGDFESKEINSIISSSDYKNKVKMTSIPECLISADCLRLTQTIDNIISNSYKYANSDIELKSYISGSFLVLEFEDYGEALPNEVINTLKEKYSRGPNSNGKDGAGLGLFLSNYFMENMEGSLEISNGIHGFNAKIYIKLS